MEYMFFRFVRAFAYYSRIGKLIPMEPIYLDFPGNQPIISFEMSMTGIDCAFSWQLVLFEFGCVHYLKISFQQHAVVL